MLYIHKYSFRLFMYINRVKRNVGMVTCPRALLPLAWHLLEHTAAPSVTLNRNKWHRFKTPGSFHFCSSKVLKSFDVTKNDKARVVSSTGGEYVYPRIHLSKSICICRNTLTFYEKGVNACELWKAFDWNALCYGTISSTVWRRKLEWYLKSRCIFSESRGYYRRNRTFRY